MPLLRRQFIRLAAAAVGAAIIPRPARSQIYPGRLIKVVVPFPAGGPTDVVGRMAAQFLSSSLGQNVVVENIAGAGGTIGSQAVARASPDGYTLLAGFTTNAISAALYRKLAYDPVLDFVPVASLAVESEALVVHPSVPAATIGEFLDRLKADPGRITCGVPTGVMPHVMAAFFLMRAGVNTVLAPYRGGAPLMTDLLSGQVQMAVASKASAMPHIQAGRLRPLAVTSEARWAELPGIPTMHESGFSDFPTYQWFGLLAPARTPAAIVDRLNATINDGLKSAEPGAGIGAGLGAALAKLGLEARIRTPSELQQLLLAEARQWDAIVTATGLRVD